MKEKLQEYALLAEIISAVCIVLSLIFVGLQVQQGAEATDYNTEATRGSVRESMMNAELNVLNMVADHPYLLDFSFNPEEYSGAEVGRANSFFIMMMRTREHYWRQYENGFLDEATYKSYRMVLLTYILQSEFYYFHWSNLSKNMGLTSGFVEEINAEISLRGLEVDMGN